MAESPRAHSWFRAKQIARNQGYNQKVEVPKSSELAIPAGFEKSRLSIPKGAQAVYRDQKEADSFQIREYEDKWTIELDRHNPEKGNAIAHAVTDAPVQTAVAVAGALAVFGSG